jgi:hypothetical protein
MKKVSTAARKQSRNFSQQKLTTGLDLGDRSSWYCVLDESGAILLEERLSTTPKAMREVFGAMAQSRIALETGMPRLAYDHRKYDLRSSPLCLPLFARWFLQSLPTAPRLCFGAIRKLPIPNARSGIKKSNHYAMSMGATLGRFSNAAAAEVL